jgi:hypothetical protein
VEPWRAVLARLVAVIHLRSLVGRANRGRNDAPRSAGTDGTSAMLRAGTIAWHRDPGWHSWRRQPLLVWSKNSFVFEEGRQIDYR